MLGQASAADITFESTVNSNKVSIKEAIQLTLTVTGYKDNLDPVSLPNIDGFDARYVGPSTSISIVNGAYHSERSFNYNLFPNKTGHFQIPAINATIGGQSYATKPIEVDVLDAAVANNADGSANSEAVTSESLKDKIMLKLSVSTENVYLNERIPLTIKLFVRDIPMRDIQMPKLEPSGFVMDAFQQPQQYSQTINGLSYEVVDFKVYIYPTQAGELNINPAKIEGNLIFKKSRRNGFNDDFFNSLFDSYAARPVTASSNNIRLNVQVLPEGKPDGFNGAVGQFDFEASVSPSEVKVGDPLTLRMKISGNGNFKNLRLPLFSDERFKTYDPQIKDADGVRSMEQVIIPTSDKIDSVGPISFVYFDPMAKEYKIITQGPFALKVAKADPNQEFKAVGFAELHDKPGMNQQAPQVNINFWMEWRERLVGGAIKLSHSLWFWLSLIALIVVIAGWKIWSAYRDRLATDTAFARRLRAFKGAQQGLVQAKQALHTQDPKAFYVAVAKTINTYFADKMHKGLGVFDIIEIQSFLKAGGVDEAQIKSLRDLLSTCDAVSFAGQKIDLTQMQVDFSELQRLLTLFEKKLK